MSASSAFINHFTYSLFPSLPFFFLSVFHCLCLCLQRKCLYYSFKYNIEMSGRFPCQTAMMWFFIIVFVFMWPIKKWRIDFFATRHNEISESPIVISILLIFLCYFLASIFFFLVFFIVHHQMSVDIIFLLKSHFKHFKINPFNVVLANIHFTTIESTIIFSLLQKRKKKLHNQFIFWLCVL